MGEKGDTIINVAGDYVDKKRVEYEIGNVAEGGVGLQVNHNHYYGAGALPIPKENNYNEVREYVEARCAQDGEFKAMVNRVDRTRLASRLSELFGWMVDAHSLGVNMGRHIGK